MLYTTKATITIDKTGQIAALKQNAKTIYAYLVSLSGAFFEKSAANYLNDREFTLTHNSLNDGFNKLLIKFNGKSTKIEVKFTQAKTNQISSDFNNE